MQIARNPEGSIGRLLGKQVSIDYRSRRKVHGAVPASDCRVEDSCDPTAARAPNLNIDQRARSSTDGVPHKTSDGGLRDQTVPSLLAEPGNPLPDTSAAEDAGGGGGY